MVFLGRWLSLLATAACVWPSSTVSASSASSDSDQPHSRQKRLLWLTSDGRLALPPGSTLVITPSLSLPFVRYPPEGFFSNMTISLPFTIDFDKLGLTDNQNPYGVLPPLLARSMGRATGQLVADYVGQWLQRRRTQRSVPPSSYNQQQQQPKKMPDDALLHGGERAMLYGMVEDMLANFGMDGKACLLRAICEAHGQQMHRFGFLGEVLKLFFTASKSPFADALFEYVEAERSGTGDGECWRYYKHCSKSLFLAKAHHKYRPEMEEDELSDQQPPSELPIQMM